MKIGIISDTHDNLANCRKACDAFADEGVKVVLHAGDLIAPFVAPIFHKSKLKLIAVFGNNDGEKLFMREKFAELGFELHHGPHEFELHGHRICLMHEPRCLDSLVKSGNYDLIIYGHTHELVTHEEGTPACRNILRRAGTLVINPGEACGYLSGKATCAVVNLEDISGRVIEL
ncbi:MAG: metallophosphoesterase [Candidatus Edwardsbacteria bacterium]|nr:metallophosphoesterase [Candidatus Edwardsbacteria bacterium]